MIQKILAISILITTISGCSLLGTKQVEIVSKPVKIDIIQPTLPREIKLNSPKWYVVSEAIITNPCIKRLQDDGSMKRPKECLPEDRENPGLWVTHTLIDSWMT